MPSSPEYVKRRRRWIGKRRRLGFERLQRRRANRNRLGFDGQRRRMTICLSWPPQKTTLCGSTLIS